MTVGTRRTGRGKTGPPECRAVVTDRIAPVLVDDQIMDRKRGVNAVLFERVDCRERFHGNTVNPSGPDRSPLVIGKPHDCLAVKKHRPVIARFPAQVRVPAEIAGFRAIDVETFFRQTCRLVAIAGIFLPDGFQAGSHETAHRDIRSGFPDKSGIGIAAELDKRLCRSGTGKKPGCDQGGKRFFIWVPKGEMQTKCIKNGCNFYKNVSPPAIVFCLSAINETGN